MDEEQSHFGNTQAQKLLEEIRTHEHPNCLFCSVANPLGFKLDFQVHRQGNVSATFMCDQIFQSYPETLHGGITSALLDAAMTNCLFSLGVAGVTGELKVRYLNPVDIDSKAEILASLKRISSPLYYLSAELKQYDAVVVRATATFVDRRWAKIHWKTNNGANVPRADF